MPYPRVRVTVRLSVGVSIISARYAVASEKRQTHLLDENSNDPPCCFLLSFNMLFLFYILRLISPNLGGYRLNGVQAIPYLAALPLVPQNSLPVLRKVSTLSLQSFGRDTRRINPPAGDDHGIARFLRVFCGTGASGFSC